MLNTEQRRILLEQIVEQLELPPSAYEKAAKRYEDIGSYISEPSAACGFANPQIFPQGSFRLGTAIRPLGRNDEYDLDLACSLREGVSVTTHSQADVKRLVGQDLDDYRQARGIQESLGNKHRCWRLEYQDGLSFHLDVVPCIPAAQSERDVFFERMIQKGLQKDLAGSVSALAVNITDDREASFREIAPGWLVSNPEGYATWFEHRMDVALANLTIEKRSEIQELPTWARKTPLQRAIQILKRHRDKMFSSDPDVKPISVILTTISARAYDGSSDLVAVLDTIIAAIVAFALSEEHVCPNPVNPVENFADRWTMPSYSHLNLKQNFKNWALQLQSDFRMLSSAQSVDRIAKVANDRMEVRISTDDLSSRLGVPASASVPPTRRVQVTESRPWCGANFED